jgi:hypothetical protein
LKHPMERLFTAFAVAALRVVLEAQKTPSV